MSSTVVWVVVVDYGLNGADCMGVFQVKPTPAEVEALSTTTLPGLPYAPRDVPGYSGIEVQRHEVEEV